MSSLFPATSLQDLDATRGTSGQKLNSPNHITHHALEDDTIEALQAKVGVDGSAVTTTHDYKLGEVTGSDKAVGKTATQTLTNKTLTSPTVNSPTLTNSGNTITLPTTTETLVGRATTDTLTNKTIVAANNTISGITEAMQTLADNTTLDVSTSKHGYVPKAPNDTTKFLNGAGAFSVPSITRRAGVGSDQVATNQTITIAHGLGTTPTYIKITFLNVGVSAGVFDYMQVVYVNGGQTGIGQILEGGTSTAAGNVTTARIYNGLSGGATGTDVVINAPDATNISFTTTKFNTPGSSTYVYQWEAFA